MGLFLFIKVVKLLSRLTGDFKLIFCESWCPSRVCFESTFVYHSNGCSDRRCEGWFINGIVVGRPLSFLRGIIKSGYGKVLAVEKYNGKKRSEDECR